MSKVKPVLPEFQLRVVEARGLIGGDRSTTSDPYVMVKLKGLSHFFSAEKQISGVVWNNSNPVWNQDFMLHPTKQNDIIQIRVYDKERSGNTYLGKVELLCSQFHNRGLFDVWLPLIGKKGMKVLGEVHLVGNYSSKDTETGGQSLGPSSIGYSPYASQYGGSQLRTSSYGSEQLGTVPLGGSQLRTISYGSEPLGTVPLGGSQFRSSSYGSEQLGTVPLGGSQLRTISYGSEPLGTAPLGGSQFRSSSYGSEQLGQFGGEQFIGSPYVGGSQLIGGTGGQFGGEQCIGSPYVECFPIDPQMDEFSSGQFYESYGSLPPQGSYAQQQPI